MRKVQYSELPKAFFSGLIVASCRIFSCFKQPQVRMLNLGHPPSSRTVAINSLEARLIGAFHALIGTILLMRTLSKITASIIKTVSVYMVNLTCSVKEKFVHVDDSPLPIPNSVMATSTRFFCRPFPFAKARIVFRIDYCEQSFCKRNGKVVLRLGSLLKQVAHRNTLRCAGLAALLYLSAIPVFAKDSARGFCEEPNQRVVTSGLNSTTRVQSSHPSCTITVYVHGGGLATIYSDNNNTPLANPFTSQSNGQFQFYAQNGRYDVTTAGAGFTQTLTYSDILLCDPFETGSTCNNGGQTVGHNLLSTTHLDTVPFSPPVQGDVITAQTTASPTGVTPAWNRLALGTLGQVLYSTGTDAIWGSLIAGSGITITPGSSGTTIASAGGGSITINGSTCTLGSTCNSGHHGLEFTIYNGGTALNSGTTPASYALMATVPFACTITRYSLAADQGTVTVKFWKVATGTAIPVVGNSINTSGVSLSSGTKIDSTTLSDFTTTAIALNDSIIMDITTVAGGMTYLDGVLGCSE